MLCYDTRERRSMECIHCQKTEDDTHLMKCPICFKFVCEECQVNMHGRGFCSRICADLFFFGDDEEE